jgi:hypothetical protein
VEIQKEKLCINFFQLFLLVVVAPYFERIYNFLSCLLLLTLPCEDEFVNTYTSHEIIC